MVREPDGHRPGDGDLGLRIDTLLRELIDQAEEVLQVRDRLRKLMAANRLVMAHLALPEVLQQVTMAAVDLTGAQYAALGVLGADGGLEQFLHTGMDPVVVERIDHLPLGLGLLGAVITEAVPIRLDDLAADHRSSGFPAEHPPMHSFLGVPIRLRDEIYGNLYLADPRVGAFTEEDTEIILSLAATAATAIENARLYDVAQLRQRWLQAANQLMVDVLTASADLQHIIDVARDVAGADVSLLGLPLPGNETALIEVASGFATDDVAGATFPLMGTQTRDVLNTGQPVRGNAQVDPDRQTYLLPGAARIGPLMIVPLTGSSGTRGVLILGREEGGADFHAAELDMAATFAAHAAVALELVEARAVQARIDVLEDRERIARDLHDHVIQRLFAVGLRLQGGRRLAPPPLADRIDQAVDDLDETMTQIRSTIFELNRRPARGTGSLRRTVLTLIDELEAGLPGRPTVQLLGPLDSLVPDPLVTDVAAVLRESLANVARHAQARHVQVRVELAHGELTVEVTDDGIGFPDHPRRSGLANLRRRAERHGGTLWLSPAGHPGATVRWSVPLTDGHD